jgi:hypothetical protein
MTVGFYFEDSGDDVVPYEATATSHAYGFEKLAPSVNVEGRNIVAKDR